MKVGWGRGLEADGGLSSDSGTRMEKHKTIITRAECPWRKGNHGKFGQGELRKLRRGNLGKCGKESGSNETFGKIRVLLTEMSLSPLAQTGRRRR